MFGMWATIKGLIAMMIGGLGSIPGAILGGLVLGVVEAHSQWLFGPQMRDLFAYLAAVRLLVLRPGGLLGGAPLQRGRARGERVSHGRLPRRRPRPISASFRSSRCRPICCCSPVRSHSASRPSSRSAPMPPASRPPCGAGRWRSRSLGRRRRRSAAAALVGLPTLRLHGLYFADRDARLRRNGAARFRVIPLSA